jgi:hypothetical protein
MSATGNRNVGAGGSAGDRISAAFRALADSRTSLERGTTITGFVGVVIIVALGGWLAYGYITVKPLLEPKGLVAYADTMLMENLTPARVALEREIKKEAPTWAKDSSTRLLEAIPKAREWAEDAILARLDETIEHGRSITRDSLRTFVRDNRKSLQEAFTDLAKNPKQAEKALADMQSLFERNFGKSMKDDSEELLATFRHVNLRLERLTSQRRLTDEESVERQILRIARRLQMQQADPKLATAAPRAEGRRRVIEGESPTSQTNVAPPPVQPEKGKAASNEKSAQSKPVESSAKPKSAEKKAAPPDASKPAPAPKGK